MGNVDKDHMVLDETAIPCVMRAVSAGMPVHALAKGTKKLPAETMCLEGATDDATDARGALIELELPKGEKIRVRDDGEDFVLAGGALTYWDGNAFVKEERMLPKELKERLCKSPATTTTLAVQKKGGKRVLTKASFAIESPPWPPSRTVTGNWCDGHGDDGLGGMKTCGYGDALCTICIDLVGGTPRVIQIPKRNVLRPNQGVRLVVRHDLGTKAKLALDGSPALTTATVSAAPKASDGHLAPLAKLKRIVPVEGAFLVTTTTYAPRASGIAKLTASSERVTACANATNEAKLVLELMVDTLTWGAVRAGVGAVLLDAASPDYRIEQYPGSEQAEIVEFADMGVNFEVVLGFSPYLIDLIAWGGRSHTGGSNAYVAPYIGFGLVGQSGGSVDALSSLHLGVEVEASPNFSIAPTFVMRRTKTLLDGLSVGSPANAGDNVTKATTGLGFGLVLSANPDFLRFEVPTSGTEVDSSANAGNTTDHEDTESEEEADE